MAPRTPNVLWAQRSDKVYLTIDLQEAESPKIKLENDEAGVGRVEFSGSAKSHATGSEAHEYALKLELYGPVDPENSKTSVTPRTVFLIIAKKIGNEGYWPRLLKEEGKQLHVKVDWDKWLDEDDEDDTQMDPSSQFDLSNLSDFSNFKTGEGAALGEEDSDDEDLPDLEKA